MSRSQYSYPVGIGATVYIDTSSVLTPATITAIPEATGTLAISYSTTPRAFTLGAAANWIPWPAGTFSATTTALLAFPINAIRAVSATAAGVVEIVG